SIIVVVIFFFSSRRRHTRCYRDWSSDVCSSDLAVCLGGPDEQSKAQALEHSVMNVNASERVGRLEEGIVILRKLFAEKNVAHAEIGRASCREREEGAVGAEC